MGWEGVDTGENVTGDEGQGQRSVAFQFQLRRRAIRLSLTNTRQDGIDDYGQTCLLHQQEGRIDG